MTTAGRRAALGLLAATAIGACIAIAGVTPASALAPVTVCQGPYSAEHKEEQSDSCDVVVTEWAPGGIDSPHDFDDREWVPPHRPDRDTEERARHCKGVRTLLSQYEESLAAAEAAIDDARAQADKLSTTADGLFAELLKGRSVRTSTAADRGATLADYLAGTAGTTPTAVPTGGADGSLAYVIWVDTNSEVGAITAEALVRAREAQAAYERLFAEWSAVAEPAARDAQAALDALEATIADARAIIPLLRTDLKHSGC